MSIRVGGIAVDEEVARRAVETYLTSGDGLYAYPSYDKLSTNGSTTELCDGDLLAPTLLNAAPTIEGFATLKCMQPALENGLEALVGLPELTEIDPAQVRFVAAAFSALDAGDTPGVRGTTVAKVLHRKRPDLIPLYDRFIYQVFVTEEGAPIPRAKDRSWVAFMELLVAAMRSDLLENVALWDDIRCVGDAEVSRVRALDIVAWTIGRDGTEAPDITAPNARKGPGSPVGR
jgi:hypothetical protein